MRQRSPFVVIRLDVKWRVYYVYVCFLLLSRLHATAAGRLCLRQLLGYRDSRPWAPQPAQLPSPCATFQCRVHEANTVRRHVVAGEDRGISR